VLYLKGPVTAAVAARPVAQVPAHLAGVLAELDEVPGRVLGLDMGFGGQHGVSLSYSPRYGRVRLGSW
jgi:hypothetical protein